MDRGTVIVSIPQEDSPAQLMSTTHSASDLLAAVTLKNVCPNRLSACRLGWVVVFPSGNEVHLGAPINIPMGLDADKTWATPPQSVSPEHTRHGAIAIAFFVAEIYPSSGDPWKADLARIRQQAAMLALRAKGQGP